MKENKVKELNKREFEEYLDNIHAEQYVGLDDLLPDDRNDWYEQLDIEEVIDYAERYISQNYIPKSEVEKLKILPVIDYVPDYKTKEQFKMYIRSRKEDIEAVKNAIKGAKSKLNQLLK